MDRGSDSEIVYQDEKLKIQQRPVSFNTVGYFPIEMELRMKSKEKARRSVPLA